MVRIEFINETEIISFTKHGDERRIQRDGEIVGLTRNDIEEIVKKNFKRMLPWVGRFNSFVLKNIKNGLNIVGTLLKEGEDWVFKVITVMFKKNFNARPADLVINIKESVKVHVFDEFIEKLN